MPCLTKPVYLAIAALGAALAMTPATAVTQTTTDERVDRLYEQAKDDLKEQRYSFALETFRKGLALTGQTGEKAWQMLLGIALTYEYLNQPDHTIEYYRRFLDSIDRTPELATGKWEQRRRVVRDQVAKLEVEILQTRGAIAVNSSPQGARLLVDGRVPGADGDASTPFTLFAAPGPHVVRLEADGFEIVDVPLSLEAGARETVMVPLRPLQRDRTLRVRTDDAEAEVRLDGALFGRGAEVSGAVTPGPHSVEVRYPGGATVTREASVAAGQTVTLKTVRAPAAPAVAKEPVPGPVQVVATPAAPTPEPTPAAGSKAAPRPLWGWIGAGGGLALVATGVVLSVLSGGDVAALADMQNDPPPSTAEEHAAFAERWNSLRHGVQVKDGAAVALYSVGGAAVLGSAAYLVFFADWGHGPLVGHGRPAAGWPFVTAGVSSSGASAVVGWSW